MLSESISELSKKLDVLKEDMKEYNFVSLIYYDKPLDQLSITQLVKLAEFIARVKDVK